MGKIWVAREKRKVGRQSYTIGPFITRPLFKKPMTLGDVLWRQPTHKYWDGAEINLDASQFQRVFPNIRLKPGEGPIRVELTARVCEKGE